MAIKIETTQNVHIEYEPAGLGLRTVGYFIDWLIILLWMTGWYGILAGLMDINIDTDLAIWVYILIMGIPVLFYDLLFEWLWKGKTPAKRILNIRVVNLDGTTPSVGSYLIRWLFRLVDFSMFNYVVGFVMVLATDKSQRLGDYLAGTTVINLKASKRNKALTLKDLEFHLDYTVSYPDILQRLTDKDMRTIRTILEDDKLKEDVQLVSRVTNKVKEISGYQYYGSDLVFLKKIVDDYNYLSLQV